MKKINQIATINDVSLNDKLKEWNETNDAFRVQLRIAYAADNSKDDKDDDLLSLADFEEAGDDPAFLTLALGVAARARHDLGVALQQRQQLLLERLQIGAYGQALQLHLGG